MLLPALDATANGITELYIHSPGTSELVLPLRRYPGLGVKKSFVAGTGDNHRVIGLGPVASALSSVKRAAFPAFHAFNGTDITRSFSGKGKLSCWKTFMDKQEDTITALRNVGTTVHPPDEIMALVEKFNNTNFISLKPVSHKLRN